MADDVKQKTKKLKAVALVDINSCTGWGICAAVCPKLCIDIILSDINFTGVSYIHEDICTGCNICAIDCPWDTITMKYPDGRIASYQSQLEKAKGYR